MPFTSLNCGDWSGPCHFSGRLPIIPLQYSICDITDIILFSIFRHQWSAVTSSLTAKWRPSGGEEYLLHTVPMPST